MDRQAMRQRCPSSYVVGPATLMGFSFFIMADGYASVRREPSSSVAGLLWEIALDDIPALDDYEEVATGLYAKRQLPVETADGRTCQALVYVGRNTRPGMSRPGYMDAVLTAAESAGLPPDHLRTLRGFVPARSRLEG